MSPETLEQPRTLAVPFDSVLRYWCPSTRNPNKKYLVEIDAYDGNGMCVCKDFACRREPFLRRGLSPAWAIQNDLPDVDVRRIKLKPGQRPEDALRCCHILIARSQFLDDVLAEIKKRRTPEERRADRQT